MKYLASTQILIPYLCISGGAILAATLAATWLAPISFSLLILLSLSILVLATILFFLVLRRVVQPPATEGRKPPPATKDLDRLKALFTASLSHELLTSLNAIIGFTSIILQGMSGKLTDKQRDQLERVLVSARRLLIMISDVINIAKIDTGNFDASPSDTLVEKLLREAVDEIDQQNRPDFKEVAIDINVPSRIVLRTDRRKLRHCLINLLIFIVEYARARKMTITAGESDNRLAIAIDFQYSIPSEELEAFFRRIEPEKAASGRRVGPNLIRLRLITKTIEELLGGRLSYRKRDRGEARVWLSFDNNNPPQAP